MQHRSEIEQQLVATAVELNLLLEVQVVASGGEPHLKDDGVESRRQKAAHELVASTLDAVVETLVRCFSLKGVLCRDLRRVDVRLQDKHPEEHDDLRVHQFLVVVEHAVDGHNPEDRKHRDHHLREQFTRMLAARSFVLLVRLRGASEVRVAVVLKHGAIGVTNAAQ